MGSLFRRMVVPSPDETDRLAALAFLRLVVVLLAVSRDHDPTPTCSPERGRPGALPREAPPGGRTPLLMMVGKKDEQPTAFTIGEVGAGVPATRRTAGAPKLE